MGVNKSREKLKRAAEEEVTKMFENILDYAQVACAQPDTYKALRSKILRAGNNCIRSIKSEMDTYEVKYIPTAEDVIEVCK
jgi:hypothetical protein